MSALINGKDLCPQSPSQIWDAKMKKKIHLTIVIFYQILKVVTFTYFGCFVNSVNDWAERKKQEENKILNTK